MFIINKLTQRLRSRNVIVGANDGIRYTRFMDCDHHYPTKNPCMPDYENMYIEVLW